MMSKINIIMNREKRIAYNYIKIMGINNDGIIFGGMVRDEIIASHYKSLFDDYSQKQPRPHKCYDKFWNSSFHPETVKRIIIPNDIDIYFSNNQNAEGFINGLRDYIKLFNGRLSVIRNFLYEFGENFIHNKVIIEIFIGKTFSNSGIRVRLTIDIIINNNEQVVIEPPFNNADFSCNLFVMSKTEVDKYEIRLSKNTGTKLDQMSYVRKLNLKSKIVNDLIAGNTEFIRKSITNDAEYISGTRILKMLDKLIKITNLPFREIDTTTIEQDCDICQISIQSPENRDTFVEILTNKHAVNVMHKQCFIKYLRNEVYKKKRNTETNKIECRCTRRNLFNFNESYKSSCLY